MVAKPNQTSYDSIQRSIFYFDSIVTGLMKVNFCEATMVHNIISHQNNNSGIQ